MAKLTVKQKIYADEYLTNGQNMLAAHKIAYPTTKDTSRGKLCQGLMASKVVKAYINERLMVINKKAEEKFNINTDSLIRLTVDALDMAKEDRNLNAYLKGIELLGKFTGAFAPMKTETKIVDEFNFSFGDWLPSDSANGDNKQQLND